MFKCAVRRMAGLFILFTVLVYSYSDEIDPDQMVKMADNVMVLQDFSCNATMIVQRSSNETVEYRMKVQGSGTDKMLIVFNHPARLKGQAFLRNGENMWLYLPNLNKTLRIPPKDAFMGGDFSNHDILSVELCNSYKAELLPDDTINGVLCHCLNLSAKDKSAQYAIIKYWINKADFFPIKRVFCTIGGRPFKTLEFVSSENAKRPDTYIMTNVLEKNKITKLHWSEFNYTKNDPTIFTENYLIRRR